MLSIIAPSLLTCMNSKNGSFTFVFVNISSTTFHPGLPSIFFNYFCLWEVSAVVGGEGGFESGENYQTVNYQLVNYQLATPSL